MIERAPEGGTPQWSELIGHILVASRVRADLWNDSDAAKSEAWLLRNYYQILTPNWARESYGDNAVDGEFSRLLARRCEAEAPKEPAGSLEPATESVLGEGGTGECGEFTPGVSARADDGRSAGSLPPPEDEATRSPDRSDLQVAKGIILFLLGVVVLRDLPLGASLDRIEALRALGEWSRDHASTLQSLATAPSERVMPTAEPWGSARLICPDTDFSFSPPTSVTIGRVPFPGLLPPVGYSFVVQGVKTTGFEYFTLLNGILAFRIGVTDFWAPPVCILAFLLYVLCLGRFLLGLAVPSWAYAAAARRLWTAALVVAVLALPSGTALLARHAGYQPGLDSQSPGLIIDNATDLGWIAMIDGRPVPLLPHSLVQQISAGGRSLRVAAVAPHTGATEAATVVLPVRASSPCIYNIAVANSYSRGQVKYR